MLNLGFLSLDVVAGPEVLNVSMPIAVQMTAVIDGACWLGSAEVQMLLEFGKNPLRPLEPRVRVDNVSVVEQTQC